ASPILTGSIFQLSVAGWQRAQVLADLAPRLLAAPLPSAHSPGFSFGPGGRRIRGPRLDPRAAGAACPRYCGRTKRQRFSTRRLAVLPAARRERGAIRALSCFFSRTG